jgi:hypothetical protein
LHAEMSEGKLTLNYSCRCYFLLVVANSPEPKKCKKVMTGVGLEPTLSFPNQEIDIKVNLNLAP